MNREELEKILFVAGVRIFTILDGASVPDLPLKLYETRPPRYCLFTGELEPDMAEVAPYLVRLYPRTPFTNWLLDNCWGKHWGIFAHSRKTLKEMRKHFRALVNVYDEKGNPMMFRYYDPRVIEKFLPTCNSNELDMFFGGVKTFFAESKNAKKMLRFENSDGILKQSAIDAQ